jgi:hypothetical protein
VNSRYIDWIWHIRGSLPLAAQQSSDDAFDRLAPLFHQTGTHHTRDNDTLTFSKKDQAAQDKMSIFDGGVLQFEKGMSGPVLRYNLKSRVLLFCFLAPLLFLFFAQATIVIGKLESPTDQASGKEKAEKKPEAPRQNAIDTFLGAPAPEKAKDDKTEKSKDEDNKSSPTSAYVFAALFAVLYGVGRILEAILIRRLFAKKLLGS